MFFHQSRNKHVQHQGETYIRIDPESINISDMTLVQKVTDVIALKVISGRVKVITGSKDAMETQNYALAGDYIIYNVGTVKGMPLLDQMRYCDRKVIKPDNFFKLYSSHGSKVEFSEQDMQCIISDLKEDNEDNSDFSDFNFVTEAYRHEYIGKPVSVARVPFNFVIAAPWGSDQFIRAGGYVIFNPNTSNSHFKDIYGIEGAHHKQGGQLERTYQIADNVFKMDLPDGTVINDTFKMVIRADKSPIAGIQFNMVDLSKAYERVGKQLKAGMEKYLGEEFVR